MFELLFCYWCLSRLKAHKTVITAADYGEWYSEDDSEEDKEPVAKRKKVRKQVATIKSSGERKKTVVSSLYISMK